MDDLTYNNMDEYYKAMNGFEILERFNRLLVKSIIQFDQFTYDNAQELIYILENHKEEMQTLGTVFKNSGYAIDEIGDEEWASVLCEMRKRFPKIP